MWDKRLRAFIWTAWVLPGAIVAVTLQSANRGDTTSITETIEQADENLVSVMADQSAGENLSEQVLREWEEVNAS